MQKDTLQKIYLLRKIEPDKDWEKHTLKSILGNTEKSFLSFRARPVKLAKPLFHRVNSAQAVSTAMPAVLVVLLAFIFWGLSAFPLLPRYGGEIVQVNFPPVREGEEEWIQTTETTEETVISKKAKEDKEAVAVMVNTEESPLSAKTSELESELREIQRLVLGTKIRKEVNEETLKEKEITDQVIAEYLVEEMESSFTLQVLEKEDEAEKAREAFEEGDYVEVFDIYFKHLAQ